MAAVADVPERLQYYEKPNGEMYQVNTALFRK